MKKTVVAIVAMATLGLAAYQVAEARSGMGPGDGMMGPGHAWQATDEATQKAQEKFLAETTELRRKMAAKHAEMRALMGGANPDGKQAAKLSEEMFDLREQMRAKAKDAGLASGVGCGMCDGPGMGRGMMMGMGGGPKHRGW